MHPIIRYWNEGVPSFWNKATINEDVRKALDIRREVCTLKLLLELFEIAEVTDAVFTVEECLVPGPKDYNFARACVFLCCVCVCLCVSVCLCVCGPSEKM